MIRVESDDPEISGAQVTVEGSYKQISYELAALAAQLARHNYPDHVIMASISFGLTHVESFQEGE